MRNRTEVSPCTFQLTTSHRGRLHHMVCYEVCDIFQLTTSHRGRRICNFPLATEKIFQLTTSHRGRQGIYQVSNFGNVFQLTTSHRGRHLLLQSEQLHLYFNSLPHTEVDVPLWHPTTEGIISTHYLTQR